MGMAFEKKEKTKMKMGNKKHNTSKQKSIFLI